MKFNGFRLSLSWEIGLALTLKIVLLFGLWWLIFRVSERPTVQPDIAKHLLAPTLKKTIQ